MKQERIASMREQLVPSTEARAALEEKLAAAPKKRRVPYQKYIAAAACAALLIAIWPISRMTRPGDGEEKLHSYILVESGVVLDSFLTEYMEFTPAAYPVPEPDGEISVSSAPVEGDRDVMMTAAELEEMLLQYGVTPEELEGKELLCTWALWWRYVHENGGQVTLAGLEEFLAQEDNRAWVEEIRAWEEQHPDWRCDDPIAEEPVSNAGVHGHEVQVDPDLFLEPIPEPIAVEPEPIREPMRWVNQTVASAQAGRLYDYLREQYSFDYPDWGSPDWYGGHWLDNSYEDRISRLTVMVVREYNSPKLRAQIREWAGGGEEIIIVSCKYSYAELMALQERAFDAMVELDLAASCGIREDHNYVDLTITHVTREALAILAELDPEGDAMVVRAGPRPVPAVDTDSVTPVTYDVNTGTVTVGAPIPSRGGEGDVSTPPYNPIARPGEPGYIAPADDPAEP